MCSMADQGTTCLLIVAETSTTLRVSGRTVRRWLLQGTLPGLRLPSGGWRVPIDALPQPIASTRGSHGGGRG